MRLIFSAGLDEFFALVADFKLGDGRFSKKPLRKAPKTSFSTEVNNRAENTGRNGREVSRETLEAMVSLENCSARRRLAESEPDLVRGLFSVVIPALQCRGLIAESLGGEEALGDRLGGQEGRDSLMWVLLFLVQASKKQALYYRQSPRPDRLTMMQQLDDV